jgi:GTPase
MFKSGFVGIIGQPNAGKSSIMNSLVNEKVSIVTNKPQTTRRRVMGIVSSNAGQIVFVDAPGVLKTTAGLNGFLQKEAQDVIKQSDVLMAVIALDTEEKEQAEDVIKMVAESKKPWFLVINKMDLEQYLRRLDKIRDMAMQHNTCGGVIEFSANDQSQNPSKQQILDMALKFLPESPKPLYDVELFTPHTMKEMVAEIVREQCFEQLHHEVPYGVAVRVNKFDESDESMPRIFAEILVGRESHKPIVIGKGGAVIKEIGIGSRKSIEKMMGAKIFLNLDVSVRENWSENKNLMKELGYVVD